MAAAVYDGVIPTPPPPSNPIPGVDIRFLSQSQLYSLSSSFNPNNRCNDVVSPQIDPSVFNESAGSRKQTYSRIRLAPRTPHLRATTTAAISNDVNSDPENAENAYIVALLKQLVVSDMMNHVELVPVKIDYSHSPDVGPTGLKRKRGRPRKNKNSVGNGSERESMMEISVVDVNDDVVGFATNGVVFNENVEDRERELLNRDGVVVDLVALGAVDHPLSEEIRRRSEGLGSEEELLGFLKGLDGRWGSRRKKKRIVEATEFGNALPIGWKLVLSVKKKNGRVWLFCRRYISPSGWQFVSCKEVSSYLLSLHGVHGTKPQSSARHNDADKLASVAITDLTTEDNVRKESLASVASLPAFASISNTIQKAGDVAEDRVGEISHCKDCNLTFSKRDELLQHQSSFHRRNRNKNGVSITDGVIIKDGKYECQFCHKTFSERHRYNGHIGAHVRYQDKMAGESTAGGVREPVNPFSSSKILVQLMQGSVGSDNLEKVSNSFTKEGLNIYNIEKDQVRDPNEANGNIRQVNEDTDVVTVQSPYSVAEVLSSGNENKSFHEVSDHAHMSGFDSEIVGDGSCLQGRSGFVNGLIENSASIEKPKQDMASENSLFDSNNHVETFHVESGSIRQTSKEPKLDGENFAVNVSIYEAETYVNSLVDVPGHASNIGVLINEDDLCGRKMEVPESDPLSSSLSALNSKSAIVIEQDIKLGFCSLVSATDNQFQAEDNELGVFSQCGVSEVSNAENMTNKDYPTFANHSKLNDTENTIKLEQSLSFANLQTELHTDYKQESYRTESFDVQPVVYQTSADQTRLDILNSNIPGDLKQGKTKGNEFLGSSFNHGTNENLSSFNIGILEEDWNGPGGENIGTSAQNTIIGFGSRSSQSGDCVTADCSWTADHANMFQGCLDGSSNPQGQESSSGINESYDIRSDLLRSDRNEPVEYSFMGEERSNSLPGESKIFSTTANVGQRLDPSFWLRKDVLVQNTADSNRVTSVCVWCRNEFYNEPVQPGTQTETIGSMCPPFSSKISGQFNVL